MKANEAPEKIFISYETDEDGYIYLDYMWRRYQFEGMENIEYTHTDAFIEKALKWYCLDCECNDNCKDTKCFFYREYERYLKGGTNALPPKISGRILNEDGSISDHWHYRHFITKIQDAFIEKARNYLSYYLDTSKIDVNYKFDFIEEFIKAMKGE